MQTTIKRIIFFLLLILLWQGIVALQIWPESMIPGPISVFKSIYNGMMDLTLIYDIVASFRHLLIGLMISIVVGTGLGLLLANPKQQTKHLERWCLPYKVFLVLYGYHLPLFGSALGKHRSYLLLLSVELS